MEPGCNKASSGTQAKFKKIVVGTQNRKLMIVLKITKHLLIGGLQGRVS